MITFLPVTSFVAVARLLDNKRLNSQRVEALFILRCVRNLDGKYARFQNAGFTRMWIGYADALAVYYNLMCEEWLQRGFSLGVSELDASAVGRNQGDVPMPGWLGDNRLHATHRAALLYKDPKHYENFGWTETPVVQYLWPLRLDDGSWDLVPPQSGVSMTLAKRREEIRARSGHWMSRRRQNKVGHFRQDRGAHVQLDQQPASSSIIAPTLVHEGALERHTSGGPHMTDKTDSDKQERTGPPRQGAFQFLSRGTRKRSVSIDVDPDVFLHGPVSPLVGVNQFSKRFKRLRCDPKGVIDL